MSTCWANCYEIFSSFYKNAISAVATKHLNSKDLTLEKQVVVVTRSGHNLNDQNARIITILYS